MWAWLGGKIERNKQIEQFPQCFYRHRQVRIFLADFSPTFPSSVTHPALIGVHREGSVYLCVTVSNCFILLRRNGEWKFCHAFPPPEGLESLGRKKIIHQPARQARRPDTRRRVGKACAGPPRHVLNLGCPPFVLCQLINEKSSYQIAGGAPPGAHTETKLIFHTRQNPESVYPKKRPRVVRSEKSVCKFCISAT